MLQLQPYNSRQTDMNLRAWLQTVLQHDSSAIRPGITMREQGFKPKYPVIIIPGGVLSPEQCHDCGMLILLSLRKNRWSHKPRYVKG